MSDKTHDKSYRPDIDKVDRNKPPQSDTPTTNPTPAQLTKEQLGRLPKKVKDSYKYIASYLNGSKYAHLRSDFVTIMLHIESQADEIAELKEKFKKVNKLFYTCADVVDFKTRIEAQANTIKELEKENAKNTAVFDKLAEKRIEDSQTIVRLRGLLNEIMDGYYQATIAFLDKCDKELKGA